MTPTPGQRPLTRAVYDTLSCFAQGYASYMQGTWNPAVPNYRPHAAGTQMRAEWERGNAKAYQDVQDGEE